MSKDGVYLLMILYVNTYANVILERSLRTDEGHIGVEVVRYTFLRKSKDRPYRLPMWPVFVVTSHYQSLQIVVLLLQACLFGSMARSRTLLLQQLQ